MLPSSCFSCITRDMFFISKLNVFLRKGFACSPAFQHPLQGSEGWRATCPGPTNPNLFIPAYTTLELCCNQHLLSSFYGHCTHCVPEIVLEIVLDSGQDFLLQCRERLSEDQTEALYENKTVTKKKNVKRLSAADSFIQVEHSLVYIKTNTIIKSLIIYAEMKAACLLQLNEEMLSQECCWSCGSSSMDLLYRGQAQNKLF